MGLPSLSARRYRNETGQTVKDWNWVGFDKESKAHRVCWANRRTITVKRNVKFDKGNVLLPATVALEGGNGGRERVPFTPTVVTTSATPPQDASVTLTGTNEHEAPRTSEAELAPLAQDPLGTSFIRDPEPEPSTQTTSARHQRFRKPSAYVQKL